MFRKVQIGALLPSALRVPTGTGACSRGASCYVVAYCLSTSK